MKVVDVEQPRQEPQPGKGNFFVTLEVMIPEQAFNQLEHPSVSGHAIQIAIRDQPAHFIQFVTRQCPDTYSMDMGFADRVMWDRTLDTHYMADSQTPRWRVDSAGHPSPYYDSRGAHLFDPSHRWLSMYDEPTLGLNDERIVFCTFLINQNRVFKEVQWARQVIDIDAAHTATVYQVQTHNVDRLPDWALKTLIDEYNTNRKNGGKLIYDVPEYLSRPITREPSAILEEAKTSFLQPPPNWVTLRKYPHLFQAPAPVASLQSSSSSDVRENRDIQKSPRPPGGF